MTEDSVWTSRRAFATRLARLPEEYCLKKELGSDSTRENVAASVTTSSLVATRFMTIERQAPINVLATPTPSSIAAMGRMRLGWPDGATTP